LFSIFEIYKILKVFAMQPLRTLVYGFNEAPIGTYSFPGKPGSAKPDPPEKKSVGVSISRFADRRVDRDAVPGNVAGEP
jgi:hypothetical protein